MILRLRHGRLPGLRLALTSLALAAALAPTTASAAPRGKSPYPSGATRPLVVVRPSDLAHLSASRSASAKGHSTAGSSRRRRKPRKPVLTGNAARALIAFQAMQGYYYLQGSG